MTNIVSLSGGALDAPCDELVARLEELLQLARDGQLRGICYGLVLPAGRTEASWASDGRRWNDLAAVAIDLIHTIGKARLAMSLSADDNLFSGGD